MVVAEKEGKLPTDDDELTEEMELAIEQFEDEFKKVHQNVRLENNKPLTEKQLEKAFDKVNDIVDTVVMELSLHCQMKANDHFEQVFGKSEPDSVVLAMGFGGPMFENMPQDLH